MDDQTELKTGVDAVQCPSKKLDKALLALKVRRTVTEQQIDRVNEFAKRMQEDSSGVSLGELNIRLKALDNAFDAFNKNHLMGDLPDLRVQQSRPFNVIGLDFCGPFQIYYGRSGIVSTKGYISVFICFCTKAIHLELVEDLSAQAFLAALRRFIGRRGLCSGIYRDNANNFIGAKNELHEFYKMFKSTDIIFNEWEAAVNSTKFHLKSILQDAKFNLFEFTTLLIQIEAVLNSKPITPVPESPNDEPALTLGHFIIGSALKTIPYPDLRDVNNVSHLRRYQRLQYYLQQFWDRWSKD
ncbi:uncharacterized protein LOC119641663 [Glossina fuscipes]|uniref:Uncharacterized protein LOC119641663 n=1 Tax=Glossina fuscipes TaxID=7396 RepID=A0A9C5ZD20_9MUSC|nr:uncharacterized protein LOC119641663 [Glossina fuscipes]